MKRKLLPVLGGIFLLILVTTTAFAAGSIKLFINGRETSPGVTPQMVDGRVMVPARWVAENLGACVHWDSENSSVKIETGPGTLVDTLNALEDRLATKGEIQRVWKVNEDALLVEQVWNGDYNYFLCSSKRGVDKPVVGFIENARFQKTDGQEIVFIGKGGGDCGNYSFPYLLTYDVQKDELKRDDMFLQQDVVFGSLGWEHVFEGLELTGDELEINLKVAEDQVLAGGHRRPFTVADYSSDVLTVRIYNVTSPGKASDVLKVAHPLVDKVEWEALPAEEPVKNPALLQSSFPYGANMEDTGISQPSIRIKIYCKESYSFNIGPGPAEKLHYTYKVALDTP